MTIHTNQEPEAVAKSKPLYIPVGQEMRGVAKCNRNTHTKGHIWQIGTGPIEEPKQPIVCNIDAE